MSPDGLVNDAAHTLAVLVQPVPPTIYAVCCGCLLSTFAKFKQVGHADLGLIPLVEGTA